jgi:RimJ/RimL family protein N-acetyltransferase
MTAYTIREATEADAEKLIAYLEELSQEPDIPLPLTPGCVQLTLEQELDYLRGHIEPENSTYLVAETDGEIIGAFNGTGENFPMTRQMTGHCAELGVSVREDWRGKGVGTALMQAGLAWAREVSLLKRLQLQVFADNESALHIYKKLGFEVEGRRRNAFRRNGAYIDSILMALLIE